MSIDSTPASGSLLPSLARPPGLRPTAHAGAQQQTWATRVLPPTTRNSEGQPTEGRTHNTPCGRHTRPTQGRRAEEQAGRGLICKIYSIAWSAVRKVWDIRSSGRESPIHSRCSQKMHTCIGLHNRAEFAPQHVSWACKQPKFVHAVTDRAFRSGLHRSTQCAGCCYHNTRLPQEDWYCEPYACEDARKAEGAKGGATATRAGTAAAGQA